MTARLQRSPVGRVESFRSWSSHLFRGQEVSWCGPGIRLGFGCGFAFRHGLRTTKMWTRLCLFSGHLYILYLNQPTLLLLHLVCLAVPRLLLQFSISVTTQNTNTHTPTRTSSRTLIRTRIHIQTRIRTSSATRTAIRTPATTNTGLRIGPDSESRSRSKSRVESVSTWRSAVPLRAMLWRRVNVALRELELART